MVYACPPLSCFFFKFIYLTFLQKGWINNNYDVQYTYGISYNLKLLEKKCGTAVRTRKWEYENSNSLPSENRIKKLLHMSHLGIRKSSLKKEIRYKIIFKIVYGDESQRNKIKTRRRKKCFQIV